MNFLKRAEPYSVYMNNLADPDDKFMAECPVHNTRHFLSLVRVERVLWFAQNQDLEDGPRCLLELSEEPHD